MLLLFFIISTLCDLQQRVLFQHSELLTWISEFFSFMKNSANCQQELHLERQSVLVGGSKFIYLNVVIPVAAGDFSNLEILSLKTIVQLLRSCRVCVSMTVIQFQAFSIHVTWIIFSLVSIFAACKYDREAVRMIGKIE